MSGWTCVDCGRQTPENLDHVCEPPPNVALPPKRAKRRTETTLVREIINALNSRDDVRVWRNNTGKLRDKNGRLVSYGLAIGSADLVGVVTKPVGGEVYWHDAKGVEHFDRAEVGVFFALECKSPIGETSDEQTAWGETVQRFGGFWACVRSVQDALNAVEEAKR